ncbi:branched-chain amino acid ABC transporter permease [Acuticoccus sediminis]|uniref:Branched-chain amino acid ABC transporter permease n=1 Tax=Acuticoccus sediminis TaxID=2184697 RepID=A0A8B2NKZ9_9HYPH|nr:branched-chain amino acid ABC transporter permease [Acuticoccus sediminis]RAH99230.1 branched-chain amino acid ABC transporter permease [Acuticoccus sediminis]
MNTQLLLLVLFDGIAYGALVFLVAVGLTLVFGVMRILNVAHGSFYALGAYAAVSLAAWLATRGMPGWLALPVYLVTAVVIGVVVGGLMERFLLRRIYDNEQALQLLVTFAIFMILENLQRVIWGVQPYFYSGPLQALGNVSVGGVTYTAYQTLFLPAIALCVLLGLRFFLRHTLAGSVIVAVTEDREAAMAVGINARRAFLVTFVIGATLAALGGALASPTTSVLPGIGPDMIVLSFAVAATAGLGQIEGAALAALLIGLGRSFAVFYAPEFEVVMPYLIMVLVLLVRPEGLFGRTAARKI